MPVTPLPTNPDIDQLKNLARELQQRVRAGHPTAVDAVRKHHPRLANLDPRRDAATNFRLADAQLVIARSHGCRSWVALREQAAVVRDLTRRPDQVAVGAALDTDEARADGLVSLACLTYGDDLLSRLAAARRIHDAHPHLACVSFAAACAIGDESAVRAALDADPGAATRRTGPFEWDPILYVTYSRLNTDDPMHDHVGVATVLLACGADPDAGYLWDGNIPPFTALTGALGGGEGGQPPHRQALELAQVLLEAGADANDGQVIYNRTFGTDDRHFELLFRFGLGQGDGGPWRRRFGDALDSSSQMLRGQLHWAITHSRLARVRLLADHGVDIAAPFTDVRQHYWHDERTPLQLARLNNQPEIAACLLDHGAPDTPPDPDDTMVAALTSGDSACADAADAAHPGALDRVRAARPGLMVWAAAQGRVDVVRLLLDLGFDVNARGRGDVPIEDPWETALHHAAHHAHVELARLLLDAGADPDSRDARFDAPPLGWAQHAGAAETVELLTPLTAVR